jgi:hypothetical protein
MENKICAITEASDKYFHLTRTSIYSFIEHNKWFDGTIKLLVHQELPLSGKNLLILQIIYPKIEIIAINSQTTNKIKTLQSFKNSNKYLELLANNLKIFIFSLPSTKLLYFSNNCIFLNNVSQILVPGKLTTDLKFSLAYLDLEKSIKFNINDIPVFDDFINAINLSDHTIIPFLSVYSSSSPNAKFNQIATSKLTDAPCIVFDINTSESTKYSKINQIWLHKNHEVLKALQKPSVVTKNVTAQNIKNKSVNSLIGLERSLPAKPIDFRVSIIIPAFRAENYIEECLNSIVSQNVNVPTEILVGVDNCKPTLDKLIEIGKNYPNLKIFSSSENIGPYTMRNNLVKHSSNPILIFFDADDIMHHNLMFTVSARYSLNSIIRFKYTNFNNGSDPEKSTNFNADVAHGVFSVSRNIFNKIGGFQDWLCGADTEFIKRSANNNIPTIKIDQYLFYRRIHPQSLTQNVNTGHSSSVRAKARWWIKNNKDWKIPVVPKVVNLNQI